MSPSPTACANLAVFSAAFLSPSGATSFAMFIILEGSPATAPNISPKPTSPVSNLFNSDTVAGVAADSAS